MAEERLPAFNEREAAVIEYLRSGSGYVSEQFEELLTTLQKDNSNNPDKFIYFVNIVGWIFADTVKELRDVEFPTNEQSDMSARLGVFADFRQKLVGEKPWLKPADPDLKKRFSGVHLYPDRKGRREAWEDIPKLEGFSIDFDDFMDRNYESCEELIAKLEKVSQQENLPLRILEESQVEGILFLYLHAIRSGDLFEIVDQVWEKGIEEAETILREGFDRAKTERSIGRSPGGPTHTAGGKKHEAKKPARKDTPTEPVTPQAVSK